MGDTPPPPLAPLSTTLDSLSPSSRISSSESETCKSEDAPVPNQPPVSSSSTPEIKVSVLEAIVEIDLCDNKLRQEIIEAMAAELGAQFHEPRTLRDFTFFDSRRALHRLEIEKLEEVRSACMLLLNPYKNVVNKTNELSDAIKLTEAAIRRLIRMSKRLSSFNGFSQTDQISILKGSVIEMMCIRATKNCNYQNNYWYFVDDNNHGMAMVSMDILKNANWINLMAHQKFAYRFNSLFADDMTVTDLVCSMCVLIVPVNILFLTAAYRYHFISTITGVHFRQRTSQRRVSQLLLFVETIFVHQARR